MEAQEENQIKEGDHNNIPGLGIDQTDPQQVFQREPQSKPFPCKKINGQIDHIAQIKGHEDFGISAHEIMVKITFSCQGVFHNAIAGVEEKYGNAEKPSLLEGEKGPWLGQILG